MVRLNKNSSPHFQSLLAGKQFVTVSPYGPLDGADFGPYYPGTLTQGIQEALNSGLMAMLLGGSPNGTTGYTYDLGPNQLIVPDNQPWGLMSYLPSEGFVNTTPLQLTGVGVTIKSSTSDWILKSLSSSYATAFPSIIKDLCFVNYGASFNGGLNLQNQETQFKGVVSVAQTNNSNVASSVGVSLGPQGNNFMSPSDCLHISNYDTNLLLARDNFSLQFLNEGNGVGGTTALQIGNATNSPFNDSLFIANWHHKAITGAITNVIKSPSTLKQGITIDKLTLECGASSNITNLINWNGGNSTTPHIHIREVVDYDGVFTSLPASTGTGVYQSTDIGFMNFRSLTHPFAFGYTAFTVPSASGSGNIATNSSHLTLIIRQSGQSGTHLVGIVGGAGGASDVTLLSGTDSVFEVPPGWGLYYDTTAPSSSQVYASYGRRP